MSSGNPIPIFSSSSPSSTVLYRFLSKGVTSLMDAPAKSAEALGQWGASDDGVRWAGRYGKLAHMERTSSSGDSSASSARRVLLNGRQPVSKTGGA
jgi:hypothetical protein